MKRLTVPEKMCHPDFEIGARVVIFNTNSPLDGKTGEIGGVAAELPISNNFIVLLDEPFQPALEWPGGKSWKAIVMMGSCLRFEESPKQD